MNGPLIEKRTRRLVQSVLRYGFQEKRTWKNYGKSHQRYFEVILLWKKQKHFLVGQYFRISSPKNGAYINTNESSPPKLSSSRCNVGPCNPSNPSHNSTCSVPWHHDAESWSWRTKSNIFIPNIFDMPPCFLPKELQ